ncbi:hypothetical protein SLA2020_440060 [Shorea laevis]
MEEKTSTSFKNGFRSFDAIPNPRTKTKVGREEITVFDILTTVLGNPQTVMVREELPTKLRDERKIDIFHESESKSTLITWRTNRAPRFER